MLGHSTGNGVDNKGTGNQAASGKGVRASIATQEPAAVVVGHRREVQQIADQRHAISAFRRQSRTKPNRVIAEVVQYEVSISLDIVGANGGGTYEKTRP